MVRKALTIIVALVVVAGVSLGVMVGYDRYGEWSKDRADRAQEERHQERVTELRRGPANMPATSLQDWEPSVDEHGNPSVIDRILQLEKDTDEYVRERESVREAARRWNAIRAYYADGRQGIEWVR